MPTQVAAEAPASYNRTMTHPLPKEPAAYALALGIRVEQERTGRGFSKEQLADRSGLASRYLWRVEAGLQNVQLQTLVAISRGLDIPVAMLLDGLEAIAADPPERPAKKPRGVARKRVGAA